VPAAQWADRLKALGTRMGLRRESPDGPRDAAMRQLADRLAEDVRLTTDELIALHGLSGRAGAEVLHRVQTQYAVQQPLDEGKAALWGGAVTGALAGLKADIATGGLTLGGGMLAGGLLGALSAAGLARGYNLVRGVEAPLVSWSETAMAELAAHALLGYLAVAHYGRGRGEWAASEHPAYWREHVDAVLAERGPALRGMVEQAQDALAEGEAAAEREAQALAGPMAQWFEAACAALLLRLYPGAVEEALRRPHAGP
jgi:Domain of unknown function (DUF3482)